MDELRPKGHNNYDNHQDSVVDFSAKDSPLEFESENEEIHTYDETILPNPSSSNNKHNNNRSCHHHNEKMNIQHDESIPDDSPQYNLDHCSICLNDPPNNAINLKCGHIFCFLCVKGAAENDNRCPMCRTEIPTDFWYNQHDILGATCLPTATKDGNYWFYEAFDGWWMYDQETAREIEASYQNKRPHEQLIAGFIYNIDFELMVQRRRDGQSRARRIKRTTLNLENIKGVGGIKNDDLLATIDLLKNYSNRK